MKMAHPTGHKKEKKGSTEWYKAIEAENLKRIEAEWEARQKASK
jgi:hypothetical protein